MAPHKRFPLLTAIATIILALLDVFDAPVLQSAAVEVCIFLQRRVFGVENPTAVDVSELLGPEPRALTLTLLGMYVAVASYYLAYAFSSRSLNLPLGRSDLRAWFLLHFASRYARWALGLLF